MNHELEIADIRDFRRCLRMLERETSLALGRETDCCGVTTAQCHFLLEAESRPAASLAEFSQALSLDASTLSRTVEGLSALGFVRRETDPANRRKVAITLTEEGIAKIGSINALCDGTYRKVLSTIPAEKRATVLESVQLLSQAMKARRMAESDSAGCRCGAAE